MSEATAIFRLFAGRRRKFLLRLGEVEELERLVSSGIGEVFLRLATSRHRLADVRETIRLGLQGGGAQEHEATALVMTYVDSQPLMADEKGGNLQLAADIIGAFHRGAASVANNDTADNLKETPSPGDLSSFFRAAGAAGYTPDQIRAMTIEEFVHIMDGFKKFNGGEEENNGEVSVSLDDIAYQQKVMLEEESAGRA